MSTPAADLLDSLPHRDPFRFVTRVDELEPGKCGRGAWIVRGDEDFLRGHFPGEPVVPGVLIGEALAQLSGLVGGPGGAGRLAQIDVRFRVAVVPPAEISLFSTLTRSLGSVAMYDCQARLAGRVIAAGTIVLGRAGTE